MMLRDTQTVRADKLADEKPHRAQLLSSNVFIHCIWVRMSNRHVHKHDINKLYSQVASETNQEPEIGAVDHGDEI